MNKDTKAMRVRLAAVIVVFALTLTLARVSLGAGAAVHTIMAYEAVGMVTDKQLQALLQENLSSLVIGAVLPDGGYASDSLYGEMSHWPPFHSAYFDHVESQCGRASAGRSAWRSERCQKLIAHMMGMIAHGVADESYDLLMDARSQYLDAVDSDSPLIARDLLVDKYALVDYGYALELFPTAVSPLEDLLQVFRDMGHNLTREELMNGQQTMIAAAALERLVTNVYSDIQDSAIYPWLRNNYRDQPGGVRFTAGALANLWTFYWKRLQGRHAPAMPTLFPGPGYALERSTRDPWGRIHFLSDRPLDKDSLIAHKAVAIGRNTIVLVADNAIVITDAHTGKEIQGELFYEEEGYMVSFTPWSWSSTSSTVYRVTARARLKDRWQQQVFPGGRSWLISVRGQGE